MSKTHYELLELARTASRDEIKHAFRREIARYHPDKVQHLGPEFETVAAERSAELTQAYTTLVDPALREQYDATLGDQSSAGIDEFPPESDPVAETTSDGSDDALAVFADERAGAADFVRLAIAARYRQALELHFGRCDEVEVEGFELASVPRKSGIFSAAPPRILVRCVEKVDGESVLEAWRLAARMRSDIRRDLCLFLVGPEVAPAGELATAIQEQRRKRMPGGAKLSLVPVNTRTWYAHIPTDAPPVVKTLLALVKAA
jgi:hypothetical protein